jgi:hypothetical protein
MVLKPKPVRPERSRGIMPSEAEAVARASFSASLEQVPRLRPLAEVYPEQRLLSRKPKGSGRTGFGGLKVEKEHTA